MANDEPDYLEDPPELDWPEDTDEADRENSQLVGMASTGMPVLYNEETGAIHEGEMTEDGRATPRFDDETRIDVGSDSSIGDAIRSVGDRVGWDSLSEFGREHWEGGREPTE